MSSGGTPYVLEARKSPKGRYIPKTFSFDRNVQPKEYFENLDKEAIARLVEFPDLEMFQGYRKRTHQKMRELLQADRRPKQIIPDYLKNPPNDNNKNVLDEVVERVSSALPRKRDHVLQRERGQTSQSNQRGVHSRPKGRNVTRPNINESYRKKGNFTRDDIIVASKDLHQEITPLDDTQDIMIKTNANMNNMKMKIKELKKDVQKPDYALANREHGNMIRVSKLVYDIDIDEKEFLEILKREDEEIEDKIAAMKTNQEMGQFIHLMPRKPITSDSSKNLLKGENAEKQRESLSTAGEKRAQQKLRLMTRGSNSRGVKMNMWMSNGNMSPVSMQQTRVRFNNEEKSSIQKRFEESWNEAVEKPITKVLGQVIKNVSEHGMMAAGEKSYVINTLTEAKFKKAMIAKGRKLLRLAVSGCMTNKETQEKGLQPLDVNVMSEVNSALGSATHMKESLEPGQFFHKRVRTGNFEEKVLKPSDDRHEMFEYLKDKVTRKNKELSSNAQEINFYEKRLWDLQNPKKRMEAPKLPTYSIDERFKNAMQSVL